MADPFLTRALLAALGLAVVAAPLGSLVVWNRMAYFGETVAQAGLIGVALGLMLDANITLGMLAATLMVALLLMLAGRQGVVPLDSVLGLMHHGALALGIIATSMLKGPSVDLAGYLFGDIFAVTGTDLVWIYGGGAVALLAIGMLWQPLLRLAVHEELAAAEGVGRQKVRAAFIVLLSLTVAIAMKIVGILLVMAFLVVPAVAARPFASTPERMVLIAGLVAVGSVLAGLWLSLKTDAPGGPAIVLIMALAGGVALTAAALQRQR